MLVLLIGRLVSVGGPVGLFGGDGEEGVVMQSAGVPGLQRHIGSRR
jgi:hypothetical protein